MQTWAGGGTEVAGGKGGAQMGKGCSVEGQPHSRMPTSLILHPSDWHSPRQFLSPVCPLSGHSVTLSAGLSLDSPGSLDWVLNLFWGALGEPCPHRSGTWNLARPSGLENTEESGSSCPGVWHHLPDGRRQAKTV